jgi:hypothetical protein
VKSIFRGFVVVESIAFGPFVLGLAISSVADSMSLYRAANFAFGVALLWSWLALPHFSIQPHPWPENWDIAITLCQWGLVGLVVGRLAGQGSWASVLFKGTVSVAMVSAAVHLVIRAFGPRRVR